VDSNPKRQSFLVFCLLCPPLSYKTPTTKHGACTSALLSKHGACTSALLSSFCLLSELTPQGRQWPGTRVGGVGAPQRLIGAGSDDW
jgi:hypothetical protein